MKLLSMILLMVSYCSFIESTWKIGHVINNSDILIASASYTKPTKKKIGYLTKKIKQAEGSPAVEFDYAVHQRSSGCSRIDLQSGYYLTLEGPSVASIKWERKKASKSDAGKNDLDWDKDFYAARVFLEHSNQDQPITYAVRGYDKEDTYFNIVLSGQNGDYAISLQKIWQSHAAS